VYNAADVFVCATRNLEDTFGMTVLEAMACGISVVATDWGGRRDIIEHGQTGFLVPTRWPDEASDLVSPIASICAMDMTGPYLESQTEIDMEALTICLREVITNPDLRRKFGEQGRRRAIAEFGWPGIIQRYEGLWRQQLDDLAVSRTESTQANSVDYNKIFRHFATRTLDSDVVIALSVSADIETGLPSLRQLPAEIDPEQVSRIRENLRNGPMRLGELVNSSAASVEAAAYLLKRGQLRVVEASEADLVMAEAHCVN